jgi:fructosamine-3-kinase
LIERGQRLCDDSTPSWGAIDRRRRCCTATLVRQPGSDAAGQPVVFDPAVYFGDREADLAMTRLFGGFGRGFYDAYESTWPLAAGSSLRFELYNLYHVLNHLNLFGGGYRIQAESLVERLLAET